MSETRRRKTNPPRTAPAKSAPGPLTRIGMRGLADEMATNVQTMTEALLRATLRATTFERLLHMFLARESRPAMIEKLIDIALDAVPAEAASVMLVDDARGDLFVAAARGPVADKVKGLRMEMGAGIAGVAAMFRQTLPVSDVSRDPRFAKDVADSLGFPVKSLLAAPILHGGQGRGVIEIINRRNGDGFQTHEVELIEKIGRAAGTLLAHIAGGA